MTYIADLDPNNPLVLAHEAAVEAWDAEVPNWRELSTEPEMRPEISESDILDRNPATVSLRRYGSDDAGRME